MTKKLFYRYVDDALYCPDWWRWIRHFVGCVARGGLSNLVITHRRNFPMHLYWKCINFDYNFKHFVSHAQIDNYAASFQIMAWILRSVILKISMLRRATIMCSQHNKPLNRRSLQMELFVFPHMTQYNVVPNKSYIVLQRHNAHCSILIPGTVDRWDDMFFVQIHQSFIISKHLIIDHELCHRCSTRISVMSSSMAYGYQDTPPCSRYLLPWHMIDPHPFCSYRAINQLLLCNRYRPDIWCRMWSSWERP